MPDTLAYIRVSDPRQAGEDKVSLAEQERALTALAARLGRTLTPAGTFTDPGVSGGTANRPAFQRLLAHTAAHPRPARDGLILVYRDDRWGRFEDPEEAAHYSWLVRQRGYRVRYAVLDSDNDEVEPILRAIGRTGARAERRKIVDRATMGMRGAREQGYWVNRAPFGMRRLAVDPVRGTERLLEAGQRKSANERLKLAPGPAGEVAIVQALFARYAEGTVSLSELARSGPRPGAREWNPSSLLNLLRNPAYVGDLHQGRARGGRPVVVVANAFTGIVERALFDRVQELLRRNARETSPVRYQYPLSGLLHCATCGGAFVGGGRAGPLPGTDPRANVFYRDSGARRRDDPCPGPMMTLLRRVVEPEVIAAIGAVIAQHDLAARLAQAFDRRLASSGSDRRTRTSELTRRRDLASARRDRLVAAVAEGTLTKDEAAEQLQAARREMEGVAAELEQLRFLGRRQDHATATRDRLVALATDFPAVAARLEGTKLRELLRAWLARGTVDKHARRITLQIRTVPAVGLVSFPSLAGQAGEADTIEVVLPLKDRSTWAHEREARRRAARLAELDDPAHDESLPHATDRSA